HYFIEKMMAKDREIRYQSAQEVVTDIDATLEGAADLQYDPNTMTSELDPFETLSIKASAISGRRPAARSSVRKAPVTPRPSGQSVRLPEQRQSVRKPPVSDDNATQNGSSSSSVRLPQRRRRSQG
ncbi:MAG: hypothetical protein KDB07_02625, partial [Planctomycetes bacterium]|nr:hypothetical protein [Planctomycetota bacterium]